MNSGLDGTTDDGSSVTSSPGEVVQTAAEKAREKRLRDDPMADVIGPHFVSCRRCGNRIKLSPKSTYDPFHWQKHRERCLKKPAGTGTRRREARDAVAAPYKKPVTVVATGPDSTTPSLTTDDDDDQGGADLVKEESPSLPLSEPAPASAEKVVAAATARRPDLSFRAYLFRTRRKLTREISPPPLEPWYTWDWSQLTMPVWVIATYPDCGNAGDGNPPSTSVDVQEQSRVSTKVTPIPTQDQTS